MPRAPTGLALGLKAKNAPTGMIYIFFFVRDKEISQPQLFIIALGLFLKAWSEMCSGPSFLFCKPSMALFYSANQIFFGIGLVYKSEYWV